MGIFLFVAASLRKVRCEVKSISYMITTVAVDDSPSHERERILCIREIINPIENISYHYYWLTLLLYGF